MRKPHPFSLNGVLQNSRWPLASEAWMDYAKSHGANMFHHRMGPFYGDIDHESEWADVGGPYLGGPGSDWNPAFWAKVRELDNHARKIGANVEKVVIDTWYCKHAQWGTQQIPWPDADIQACGRRPSPEQERYIRKVVSEACDAPHVIWMTDNEGDQISGDTPEWYAWVRNVIRDEEQRCPSPVVRLIGSNRALPDLPFDYFATHYRGPLTQPIGGRHTENNERNPQFGPEQEKANFCAARAAGLHYWFWRAGMNDADFERTLDLFAEGCGGPQECFPPPTDDPSLWFSIPGTPQKRDAVAAAQAAVGERCGSVPPHEAGLATLDALAAELRRRGECAGRDKDAVLIRAPDALWEEYHAVRFTDGCWAQDPAQLPKARWKYQGADPGASCPIDVPAVDQISCNPHVPAGVYDCTPKHRGQPILPEGDPLRWPCELKAMGGSPPYYEFIGHGLQLSTLPNPMQFKLSGTGSGTVRCTVPYGTFCYTQVQR